MTDARWLGATVAAVVLLVVALLVGVPGTGDTGDTGDGALDGLALPVGLGELTRDAGQHAGRTVVLASVVEDVLAADRRIDPSDRGRSALTFGVNGQVIVLGLGDRLAALAQLGAGEAITPGDAVQVTGEVRRWPRERIERALGRPLAPQFAGEFPRTVLLARDVITVGTPSWNATPSRPRA